MAVRHACDGLCGLSGMTHRGKSSLTAFGAGQGTAQKRGATSIPLCVILRRLGV